jgi:adiponectin receptor
MIQPVALCQVENGSERTADSFKPFTSTLPYKMKNNNLNSSMYLLKSTQSEDDEVPLFTSNLRSTLESYLLDLQIRQISTSLILAYLKLFFVVFVLLTAVSFFSLYTPSRALENNSLLILPSTLPPSLPPLPFSMPSTCIPVNSPSNSDKFLKPFSALPYYLQDNPYIQRHQRVHFSSSQCLSSLFYWHADTLNIWTHLIGALLYLSLLMDIWYGTHNFIEDLNLSNLNNGWNIAENIGVSNTDAILPENSSPFDKVVISIYLLASVYCLGTSALFHIFRVHSDAEFYRFVALLDFTGITSLLIAMVGSCLYFFLLKATVILQLAAGAILAILAFIGWILPMTAAFRRKEARLYRVFFFVSMSVLGISLLGRCLINTCIVRQELTLVTLKYAILEITLFVIGAMLYVTRIPETFFPGSCDLLFQSHQLWHIFILIGNFIHTAFIATLASHNKHNF